MSLERYWLHPETVTAPARAGQPLNVSMPRDHVWSYDFVHHRTDDGKVFRTLNILDEFSRECLAIRVNRRGLQRRVDAQTVRWQKGRMEAKHIFHAVVAAPLGAIAGGGLGFGMTGEWTPLISGLVAALTSSTYLAVIHLLPKWRKRRGVADSVDARPAPFHLMTSKATVSVRPPPWSMPILRIRSVWKRRVAPGLARKRLK